MRKTFYSVLLLLAFAGNTAYATHPLEEPSTTNPNQEEGSCYGYLTGLVRSSNFPFKYVSKEKTNLLIDNDTGDSVMAQLFFDTDGTGTIGWGSTTYCSVNYSISRPMWRSHKNLHSKLPLRSITKNAPDAGSKN